MQSHNKLEKVQYAKKQAMHIFWNTGSFGTSVEYTSYLMMEIWFKQISYLLWFTEYWIKHFFCSLKALIWGTFSSYHSIRFSSISSKHIRKNWDYVVERKYFHYCKCLLWTSIIMFKYLKIYRYIKYFPKH